ncbi:MAG: DUF3226 domain-containing protein [Blastocatellia bacterium]
MPQPKTITHPKQLLVEGRDGVAFFAAWLKQLGLGEIQIQNFGGITELRPFLKALRNEPGFEEQVTSLGIIRDAETNPQGAFQSVRDALRASGLPASEKAEVVENGQPQTVILILPNATTPGMLETLCLESVASEPAIQCVDQYFDCLNQQIGFSPTNIPKARLHAFLSGKPKPGLRVGDAASAGYFPWDHPAFDHIRQFLLNL